MNDIIVNKAPNAAVNTPFFTRSLLIEPYDANKSLIVLIKLFIVKSFPIICDNPKMHTVIPVAKTVKLVKKLPNDM